MELIVTKFDLKSSTVKPFDNCDLFCLHCFRSIESGQEKLESRASSPLPTCARDGFIDCGTSECSTSTFLPLGAPEPGEVKWK